VSAGADATTTDNGETMNYGDLHDYRTGAYIRPATRQELLESIEAEQDGGTGAFELEDGRVVYVEGGAA
jgi:hypothetical protein